MSKKELRSLVAMRVEEAFGKRFDEVLRMRISVSQIARESGVSRAAVYKECERRGIKMKWMK